MKSENAGHTGGCENGQRPGPTVRVVNAPRLKDVVRFSLIATGFTTKREPTEPEKLEAEIRRLLRGLERQDKV